jgi:hypothetical protein
MPVTVTTTESGQNARLTFSGTSGQRVFVKASDVSLMPTSSYEVVDLLNPSDVRIGGTGAISSVGYIDTKTLATTGTHSIYVNPAGSATGSTTVRLFNVPADFTAPIAFGGPPATTVTSVPGQDGRLTFSASADQPLRIWRSAITIPASIVKVLRPDGTQLASSGLVGTPDNYFDTTLPVEGTYTILVDGFQDAVGQMTIRLTHPEDDAGIPGTDQSAPTGDDTVSDPATPAPVSPSGPVPASSYTTELWSPEETGAPDGLEVVSSTADETSAWTGIAVEADDGDPVSGASVSLVRGSETTTTTTDSDGAYAFINMPSGSYRLDITSPSYGTFTVDGVTLEPDELYQETAGLMADAQWLDLSGWSGTTAPSSSSTVSATDTWPSNQRPPPTVRVALYWKTLANGRKAYSCENPTAPGATSTHAGNKTYPWRYYVLRTMRQEIGPSHWPGGPDFPPVAAKAVAQAIHSYGWYWTVNRRPGLPSGADLNNTVQFQCFIPGLPVPFGWHVLANDAMRYRVVNTADKKLVRPTFHLGDENCVSQTNCPRYESVSCTSPGFADSSYPPSSVVIELGTPAVLSQLGAKAAVERCGVTDWTSIVDYYYRARGEYAGGLVREGRAEDVPPPPKATAVAGFAYIDFSFPSEHKATGKDMGWHYNIEKWSPTGWRWIKQVHFDWRTRIIPTTWRRWVSGECASYRVKAWNPYGWSAYTYFNGGAQICS